ncbi:Site-specific tyrosine recombinase XerC [hydrothermal vent metagenome]|uniref:Site-specific tyrosine recombinase XerC n=1 Tax=hydrothermal vent metagenome TaxID=652676 RepID=A0A3B0X0J0_9ZZZZ
MSEAGPFSTDLSLFYQFLQSEKLFSKHTLDSYRRDISRFCAFLSGQAIAEWCAIDEQHIRQFVALVHRQGLGGKSIQRSLSALRRLFRFLLVNNRIKLNPAAHVRAPRSERKLPDVLQQQEVEHLLNTQSDEPLMVRDYAVLELLYGCGLRISELVSLNLTDINGLLDTTERFLSVWGKGNRERRCPYGGKAAIMLKKWLKCRENLVKQDEKAVFISNRGTRLSASAIRARIHKLSAEKGIHQRIYPHLMRHSFASHLLQSSQDLRAVQELLGHAHLKTTQIYTHLDFQQLTKTYDAAHPRAQKKKR